MQGICSSFIHPVLLFILQENDHSIRVDFAVAWGHRHSLFHVFKTRKQIPRQIRDYSRVSVDASFVILTFSLISIY